MKTSVDGESAAAGFDRTSFNKKGVDLHLENLILALTFGLKSNW